MKLIYVKNYTYELVSTIMRKMNKYRDYSEEEYIVISYGLELLLNSCLKAVIYLIIGGISGIFAETVFVIFFLAVLRSFSGGYHSKTDIGCLILTGILIFAPILIAKYLPIDKSLYEACFFGALIIHLLFAPQDEKYEKKKKGELYRAGSKVIVLLAICAANVWLETDRMRFTAVLVSLEQGIFLLEHKISRRRQYVKRNGN